MFNDALDCDKKFICCYCLQSLGTAQALEKDVNDCF